MNAQSLMNLRTKKIAVLIVDARQAARRTPQECAAAVGIAPETYQAFESGQNAPSLPEIEALAFYLGVSLDHFWGKNSLSQKKRRPASAKPGPGPPAAQPHDQRSHRVGTLTGQPFRG